MINMRMIILTAAYLILIGVGIYFGIIPQMQGINRQVESLKNKNLEFQEASTKYDTLTEMAKTQDQFDYAKLLSATALPDTLEKDRLTLTLEKVSNDAGVKLLTLDVGNLTTAATTSTKKPATSTADPSPITTSIKTITGTLSGEATYDKIKTWLSLIEDLERIVVIKSFTLTKTTDASNIIKADISYEAYGLSDNP